MVPHSPISHDPLHSFPGRFGSEDSDKHLPFATLAAVRACNAHRRWGGNDGSLAPKRKQSLGVAGQIRVLSGCGNLFLASAFSPPQKSRSAQSSRHATGRGRFLASSGRLAASQHSEGFPTLGGAWGTGPHSTRPCPLCRRPRCERPTKIVVPAEHVRDLNQPHRGHGAFQPTRAERWHRGPIRQAQCWRIPLLHHP